MPVDPARIPSKKTLPLTLEIILINVLLFCFLLLAVLCAGALAALCGCLAALLVGALRVLRADLGDDLGDDFDEVICLKKRITLSSNTSLDFIETLPSNFLAYWKLFAAKGFLPSMYWVMPRSLNVLALVARFALVFRACKKSRSAPLKSAFLYLA